MNCGLPYSRPQKTADGLGPLAKDRHRFLQKYVLLTGEAETLATDNGRDAFLFGLRLLVRICPNITVIVPEGHGALRQTAEQVAAHVAFGKPVEFSAEAVDFQRFDAILSVGHAVQPGLPFTAINSNGWVARVSSGEIALPPVCTQSNPIGALAAACLGAGEVFKRLIGLDPARGSLLDGLSFSLLNYAVSPADYGPDLPNKIPSDLLVVGAGAIGNGIVALLSALPLTGHIYVVDRQEFGPENLGTCLLIGPADVDKPKAQVMEKVLLAAGGAAEGFTSSFADFAAGITGPYPPVVLNGLDNIDVRHEVQRALWPDLIVDGAIGDFTCQVSRHPWAEQDAACLLCLFRTPAHSADQLAYQETGLQSSRLGDTEAVVTSDDVQAAPPEKQEYLRARLGKPVCSVVSEAIAARISREQQEPGFEPSVPFVAAFSACMVVTEAISYLAGWPSVLETRFQFDFLHGPEGGAQYPQCRRPDCICQRRKNIAKIRASRGLPA
jgi:molybdopterin/thiamine biosynthesis adenylyltransferase